MDETRSVLLELRDSYNLSVDRKGRGFLIVESDGQQSGRVVVPALQPLPYDCQTLETYLASIEEGPGLHLIILVQAGASAMGLWDGEQLLKHKVIKKYVTRGKGKAQTTFLKTRGKSRYGSRLRLQNAKLHLQLTNEKMTEWWRQYGPVPRVFYSCPVRLWTEVFNAATPPPFSKDHAIFKIPMDVRVPCHEELLKVRRRLTFGEVI